MQREVELFFDFISPYSYLAWTQLDALCERQQVSLRQRPVLFAGLLNHWGQLGPAEIPPKREFLWKDTHRIAARLGVPFVLPKAHPFNPLLVLRLALPEVAKEAQRKVIETLWRAGWVQGIDLSSKEEVSEALSSAGLPADELVSAANTTEAKEALRKNTEEATSRGVFGVPSFLVQDEIFWGSDRLQDLENFLAGKDPIDAAKMKEVLAHYRASAERLRSRAK